MERNRIIPTFGKVGRVMLAGPLLLALALHGNVVAFAATGTWTAQASNSVVAMNGVAYGNGLWVAAEANGLIDTSPDGVHWTEHGQIVSGLGGYYSSAVYGNMWVLVGASGEIATSTDGSQWAKQASNTATDLYSVTYGTGAYVAVGDAGTVLTSRDGVTWSNQTLGASILWGVTYGGGQFVAVGDGGTIYSSADGISWARRTSSTSNSLYAVTYGNGIYATVGQGGTILTSTDGIAWTSRSSGISDDLYGVGYGAGKFVAAGANFDLLSSTNGTNWGKEQAASEPDGGFYGVAYGGSMFVTVGSNTNSTAGYVQTQNYSNNNNLSSLTLSSGTLSPAFSPSTTSYTATVSNTVTSVNITPTLSDSLATMTVNGKAATSGSAVSVPLSVGANTITVVATATSGATKAYTVTVTRSAPLSTNADLSNLTIDSGTLTPAFAVGTTSYTATVPYSASSVHVTPTVADSTATLTVNETPASSGTAVSVPLSVGANAIPIVVTAQDGTTTKTYTINVTRSAPSTNANLSNLTVDQGTLSPAFTANTTSYTDSVSHSVSSLNITGSVADSTATLKVNGSVATSGAAVSVPLNVGDNTITVDVTAEDGTTKTYTVTVTRAPGSNADLSDLSVSEGSLSPTFSSDTTDYTDDVGNSVTSLEVTPTVADSTATLTVNGQAVTSGSAVSVPLNGGDNTITVVVTTQDGTTTKTYSLTVTRAPSSNADLSYLAVSQGTLSPTFDSNTTNYTESVDNSVASLDVTPTVADSTATLTVNGQAVTSGSPVPVPLKVGDNTITVIVTAQDGTTTETYTITVTRAPSSNADLSGLTVSQGSLSPTFASSTADYTESVDNNVTSLDVTPTVADGTATLTVNGQAVTSGSPVAVPLKVGDNTITVVVTAQDGTTTKTYTITVTRAPSSNADLSNLTVSQGTLSPTFDSSITSYTENVGNSVTSLNVTGTVADGTATLEVNGQAAASGSPVSVPLTVGSNPITVMVTAQDGTTTKTYTLTVTRAPSSNADLSNLTVSQGSLSPTFASSTVDYTESVDNSVTSLDITPTIADGTATLTVNGQAATSGSAVSVPLKVGDNTITVVVTAQDGTTQKTYTLIVTRAPSSNADLSNLAVSQGTLSPVFASNTTNYTESVENSVASLNVTATVADGTATLTVNGDVATSGTGVSVPLNVGDNTITVVVIAQDGTTTKTYTLTVTRAPSSNADLSGLTISQGTLSPAFASSTVDYTESVANSVTSLSFTPTSADNTATLTVNGNAATSGSAVPVPLNVGDNTITVVVTAQDGTTQRTYTVTVTRAPSSNADLSNLAVSQETLSPTFSSNTTDYTEGVDNSVTSLDVTPTVADNMATLTVNGHATTSGSAVPVPLNVGDNTITVVVTAQDGTTTKTYTITVTRAPSSNADLSNLAVSQGTLSPVFASNTTNYTESVDNSVARLDVTPTVADGTATLTVNGDVATSGTGVSVPLNVGDNTITVVVTAQDGTTTKTYTLTVTRAPSSNADLSGITVSQGTLAPVFATGTTSYTESVDNSVTSLDVTPTTADSTATLTVNGQGATSGAAVSVPLKVGDNTITVVVTAQDGTTTKTYTLTVTRAPSSNADLSGITVSQGTLAPVFATGTTSYTESVDNSVTSLDVTPTTADSTATLTVNGQAATSGSAVSVPLNVGDNTITVVVTAQDGTTTKTYTLTVTRAPSSNADLSNLAVSQGTLSPVFATGTTSYTESVDNSVTSLDVTPTTADSTATLTVNGQAVTSGSPVAVPLKVGDNTINVVVTAQDGTTQKTYTLTVTRAPSSNADLSSLSVSQGTLSPTFVSSTADYTENVGNSVTSLDVTPTTADNTATLTVNGQAATSGSTVSVPLKVGDNTITVVVTAQDGSTTKTYTLTVTRAPSSNADLSGLTVSQGSLSPVFATGTTSYADSVGNSVTSLDITPTTSDNTATLTVNGQAVKSGSAVSVPLNVGDNTIKVIVTAQDGTTTKTYTLTITRAPSSNADLSSLSISEGALSPAFVSNTTDYTENVDNSVTSLDVMPTVADSTATLTVNGQAASSGSPVPVPLTVGNNPVTVVVTAQDGTTKTYTITVTRAPSSNADLSNVAVGQGTLSPTFDSNTTNYTESVDNSVTSLDVTPTVADSTATLTVNGQTATSGSPVAVPLTVGINPITVMVTAQDGTTKTYTITVTRAPSSNADLSNLTLNQGDLSPTFATNTTSYTDSVSNNVSSLDVTPTVADTTATLTINGQAATSGSSASIPLKVGDNTITVVVTAQDGTTTKTYTLTVTRAPSSNADLSGLAVSQGTLAPVFATGTTNYTESVDNSVTSLDVTPTVADNTATLTVNGQAATSGSAVSVPLKVGDNTITVVVTAQDGSTTKTYTLTVTRAPSSNADLSSLTVSQGTLSPVFAANTTSYTETVSNSVSSLDLTATTADSTATLTVNGTSVNSGSAASVPLRVGTNTITVIVTAQDGITQQTYTLTVTRAAAPSGGPGGSDNGGTETPSPSLPTVVMSQTVSSDGGHSQQSTGNVTIGLDVPQGAFSQPEQIIVTMGTHADVAKVVNGLSVKSDLVVFGVTFTGPAPTKPITVTLTSPSILASGVVYKFTSKGELIPAPAQISNGKAVVTFSTDPAFVVLNVRPNERVITMAGDAHIVPALVHPDAGVDTTYMPIWYVMQLLSGLGVESTWDGHTWRLTTSTPVDMSNVKPGTGTGHIYLNGTLVQNVNPVAATDPSTNRPTTFMPIWYVMQLLDRLHLKSTWDGTTWTIAKD